MTLTGLLGAPGSQATGMNAKSRCLHCGRPRGGFNETAPQRGRRLPHATQWAQNAGQGLTAKGLCWGNLGKSLPGAAWGLPNGSTTELCMLHFCSVPKWKRLAGTLMDPNDQSSIGVTRPRFQVWLCLNRKYQPFLCLGFQELTGFYQL